MKRIPIPVLATTLLVTAAAVAEEGMARTNLSYTRVSDVGLEYLRSLSGLKRLYLSHSRVSAAGRKRMRRVLK